MIWGKSRVFGGLRTEASKFGSGLRLASRNLATLKCLMFNNVREASEIKLEDVHGLSAPWIDVGYLISDLINTCTGKSDSQSPLVFVEKSGEITRLSNHSFQHQLSTICEGRVCKSRY